MPLKDKTYYELYADLLRAYRLACRHKGATSNRLRFELRREELLSELTASILRREYVPAPSTRFIVTEPFTREVIAANFRERVVHHYIDEYLSPYLERILIYDCYSCRKYKGISAGVERLEHHIRSCSQNYTKPCYVLKLDIRSYFMSISRDILYAKAQRLLRWIGRQTDPQTGRRNDATDRFRIVSYLTGQVIHCDPLDGCVYRGDPKLLGRLPASKSLARSPEGCGLPIGNLTSQLFSNLYLNDFDHYMKERLGLKHYGRYVDDFYIVHNDPGYLLSLIPAIGRFLRDDAALSLHPDKTKLANVLGGIAFLGSYIKPYRRYVLHRTVFRIREKLDRLDRRPPGYFAEPRRLRRALSSANSFLGTFVRARTYRLRQEVFRGSVMFRYCHATPLLRKLVLDRRWKEMRVIDPDRWLENEQFEKNRKNNRRIGATSGEK
ncbi:reverse transcriptase domain-containing protein [Alistipes dispar]|uniref:RNA-directed DNA polymerase n=1 Tax=Alistipes dispar TaxID=2585119 RepID=UPI003A844D3F